MNVRSQSGQATVLVLGLSLVAFAAAGVAVDGTRAFLLRRSLQNAADSAAIAGASALDVRSLYASGGGVVKIDVAAARREVARSLSARGLPARTAVEVDQRGVTLVLRGELDTSLLGLVGVRHVPVAVEARAEPIEGPAP